MVPSTGRAAADSAMPTAPRAFRVPPWLFILVVAGLAWRGVRYGLGFPFWGDEAYLNINFLHRGPLELIEPLEYAQIAPLLYLWIQWLIYQVAGGGEYALRFFSLIAGGAALVLFAGLARRLLPRPAAFVATGFFAAGYYLVRHTCESKPYAGDLLAATALLAAARPWLERPAAWRPSLSAGLLAVPLVWLSYPAVFVAGGIGLGLLPAVRRARQRSAWAGWLAFNICAGVSFAAFYVLFAATHSAQASGSWLEDYWRDSFPPIHDPAALVWWLVRIHTGRMLAYPVGGAAFGSAFTTLLCLAGCISLVHRRRGTLVWLLVAPALLTVVAAALRRYPYGGSVRVAIHLAPSICLLAGPGAAGLIERLPRGARRPVLRGALTLLVVLPVLGMIRDVARPYKTPEDAAIRRVMRRVVATLPPGSVPGVLNPAEGTHGPPDGPAFHQSLRYYLELYSGRAPRWRTAGGLDATVTRVLAYHGPTHGPTRERVAAVLAEAGLVVTAARAYPLSDRSGMRLVVYTCRPAARVSARRAVYGNSGP
jgi:hypothetical protein